MADLVRVPGMITFHNVIEGDNIPDYATCQALLESMDQTPISFNNTTSWTGDGLSNDRLESFPDLVRWCEANGLLDAAEELALAERGGSDPWWRPRC